jgi:septum formation protein
VFYGDEILSNELLSVMLASGSAQRLTLLSQILPKTRVIVNPTGIDEARFHELGPKARCSQLAHAKASAAVETLGGKPEVSFVIGADTEVICRGVELGKPLCEEEARVMLESLRGASHEVVTGVSVFDVQMERWIDSTEVTTVHFKNFPESMLEAYLGSNEWHGKSGGYALQGRGVLLAAGIQGSYSNVVGLPLERLGEILFEEFNCDIG